MTESLASVWDWLLSQVNPLSVIAALITIGEVFKRLRTKQPVEQLYDRIEKSGVAKTAIANFFRILEEAHIPPEDWDAKLRQIANCRGL